MLGTHNYAHFVINNIDMKKVLEQEREDHKRGYTLMRSNGNIFGAIISTVTGLETGV